MNHHLTDEQMSELLYGESPIDASRHLLACGECQGELVRLRASLDAFASMGLAWSEKKASVSISTPSALVRNWASMSTGAAAAVILAAAVLFTAHQESRAPVAQVSGAPSQQKDFATVVASDDELMQAIDDEILRQTESAVSNVEISVPAPAAHARPTHRLTN